MTAPDPILRLGERLLERRFVLAVAESCTGGALAALATGVPGSSRWFDRAIVAYSNEAKQTLLGVAAATIAVHGAVSEPVVAEMAAGVRGGAADRVGVALSGVAGPGGGTPAKPVGMVCFAWDVPGEPVLRSTRHFEGDRDAIRAAAVSEAVARLTELLG